MTRELTFQITLKRVRSCLIRPKSHFVMLMSWAVKDVREVILKRFSPNHQHHIIFIPLSCLSLWWSDRLDVLAESKFHHNSNIDSTLTEERFLKMLTFAVSTSLHTLVLKMQTLAYMHVKRTCNSQVRCISRNEKWESRTVLRLLRKWSYRVWLR